MKYVMGVENYAGNLLCVEKDIDKDQLKKEILNVGKYVESGDLINPKIIIQTYDNIVLPNMYKEQLQFSYCEALNYVNNLKE